jgi:lipopolysaccharide transport system permease protein
MQELSEKWDLHIKPKAYLFSINIRELIEYKDLILMFVKRDFSSLYKQTILGPLWFFIQPLLTTITFTFVFGHLAGLSTDGIPKPLFYMAGITAWGYFSECLNKTSTIFRDNSNLFGKVYFPRLIMPITIVISNLFKFGIQLAMFILLIIYYYIIGAKFQFSYFILLFPIIVLYMAMIGLGLGMIISALTTKYRDLSFLITFGVQLFMYVTPVIYPLSNFPNKFKFLIKLNPLTGIIELFKRGFLGTGYFTFNLFIYSTISSLVILFLGVIIFNKVEKNFIDIV